MNDSYLIVIGFSTVVVSLGLLTVQDCLDKRYMTDYFISSGSLHHHNKYSYSQDQI